MSSETSILFATAVSLGLFHTLLGPDHYLPFIAMAKAGKWSITKTAVVTFFSGIGHVGSSLLLGCVGAALGVTISRIEAVEGMRGSLAAWVLITFGLLYLIWGIRSAIKTHTPHRHPDQQLSASSGVLPWIIVTIFVLGPCEPLIPVLMYPAVKESWITVVLISLVFAGVTITTMLGAVVVGIAGTSLLPLVRLKRYAHALAGATIMCCGIGIRFLGF